MLISTAYAAGQTAAETPGGAEVFIWNMGLIVILVALFYFLLIMPQQKRFKEHKAMLDSLRKGDKVITGGGLLGKIDKVVDENEVVLDLGGGVKVTALRSTIQTKNDPILNPAKNDNKGKKEEEKKEDNKKKDEQKDKKETEPSGDKKKGKGS